MSDIFYESVTPGMTVIGYDSAEKYDAPIVIEQRADHFSMRLDLTLEEARKLVELLSKAIEFSTPELEVVGTIDGLAVCRCDVGSDDMQLCPIHGSSVA